MRHATTLGILLMAAVSCGSAFAQRTGVPSSSGRPMAAGQFTANQAVTSDREQFVRDWSKPGATAVLKVTGSTVPGHQISDFIVFGNCTASSSGVCDVTADFEVVDPSGKVVLQQKAVPVWHRPPAPAGNFTLSEAAIGVLFDGDDALGTYHIKADVVDNVAKVTVKTQQTLSLAAK